MKTVNVFECVWRFYVLFRISHSVYCLEVGKVNLNFTSIAISNNEAEGTIPIWLSVINTESGQEGSITGQVKVTCEQTFDLPGFTSVTFSPKQISTVNTDIRYGINRVGRQVQVLCYGESVTGTQFNKNTSASDARSFIVTPSAFVSFCQDKFMLSGVGQFRLKLSETVKTHNVTVSCTVEDIGVAYLNIATQSVVATVGQSNIQMPYNISGDGLTTGLKCTAKSQDPGKQYLPPSSDSSVAQFQPIADGGLHLLPQKLATTSTKIKSFLSLTKTLTSSDQDVTVSCSVFDFSNISEAQKWEKEPVCYVSTVPQPSVLPTTAQVTVNTTTGNATAGVNSTTTVPPTTTTTAAPTTGAPIATNSSEHPLNVSETWSLGKNTYFFRNGESFYQTVDITRNEVPSSPVYEVLLVTCCASKEVNLNPHFQSKNASVVIVVNTAAMFPVNWTNTQGALDSVKESELINPAYVNLSPCPCDMTQDQCDVGCCCDKDCDNSTQQLVSNTIPNMNDSVDGFSMCLNGVRGGFPESPDDFTCSSSAINKENWSPLLCVQFDNNPNLGMFFKVEPIISNLVSLKSTIRRVNQSYSFGGSTPRVVVETGRGTNTIGYVDGLAISILPPEAVPATSVGHLTLPSTSLGQCITTDPVRYLRNSDGTCLVDMGKVDVCTTNLMLNAQNYVQSSAISDCQRTFTILSKHAGNTSTPVYVNYFCASSPDKYLQSLDWSSDFNTAETSLFSTNQTAAPASHPVRCSWDDGTTKPPQPSLANSVCSNSVVSVSYRFVWSGVNIEMLNASIVLADLPLSRTKSVDQILEHVITVPVTTTQSPTTTAGIVNTTANSTTTSSSLVNTTAAPSSVTVREQYTRTINRTVASLLEQKFQVRWYHSASLSTQQALRSGKVGYKLGLPLLGGATVSNDNETVDSSEMKQPYVWKSDGNGMCRSATRTKISFGENTLSGCLIRLRLSDFNNCTYLRETILQSLLDLMQSDFISRGGEPNATNISDWIKISKPNLTAVFPSLDPTANTNVVTTIPVSQTTPTVSNNNSTAAPAVTSQGIPVISSQSVQGQCTNIPTGFELKIWYSQVGVGFGVPIYEVRLANLSYPSATWAMPCTGNCDADAVSFAVLSTVSFVEIPLETPVELDKYYADSHPDRCKLEICWLMLFYPWTSEYSVTLTQKSQHLGFLLGSSIAIFALYLITRPWTENLPL